MRSIAHLVAAVALALLATSTSADERPSIFAKSTDHPPPDVNTFEYWMPKGGKCVMTGPALWLCKGLPKDDIPKHPNGTCTETGPYFLSCGPQAEPFNSTSCVPSGPAIFRCGREDMLMVKTFCLEAWEGAFRCTEDKPLAKLPQRPGALGG